MSGPCGPTLLFDVLDTLVYDPFREVVPAVTGLDIEDVIRRKSPDAWPRFERGEIDEPDFARDYFRDGGALDVEAVKEAMIAAYRWLDGMEDVLFELRHLGVDMHVLSNYPAWYELIEAKLGLSQYLPWTFVSCRTGRRKPDAEAFLHAARSLARAPSECVLVDDREANCAAARAVGMRALRFEGADSLRTELGRL